MNLQGIKKYTEETQAEIIDTLKYYDRCYIINNTQVQTFLSVDGVGAKVAEVHKKDIFSNREIKENYKNSFNY